MISSNLVCFLWMLSIQYGSKILKELKVLVDTEDKPVKGLRNEIKQKVILSLYLGTCHCRKVPKMLSSEYPQNIHVGHYYAVEDPKSFDPIIWLNKT